MSSLLTCRVPPSGKGCPFHGRTVSLDGPRGTCTRKTERNAVGYNDRYYCLVRDCRYSVLREWTRTLSRLVARTVGYASFSIKRTSQAAQDVAISTVSLSGASVDCMLVRRTEPSTVEFARTFHATFSSTVSTLPMGRRVPSLELVSWYIEGEPALRSS